MTVNSIFQTLPINYFKGLTHHMIPQITNFPPQMSRDDCLFWHKHSKENWLKFSWKCGVCTKFVKTCAELQKYIFFSNLEGFSCFGLIISNSHSFTPSACRGFYHNRISNFFCQFYTVISIFNNSIESRNAWNSRKFKKRKTQITNFWKLDR